MKYVVILALASVVLQGCNSATMKGVARGMSNGGEQTYQPPRARDYFGDSTTCQRIGNTVYCQ